MDLPPGLRAAVAGRMDALAPALAPASAALRGALPRVLAASRFVGDVLAHDPARFAQWVASGWLEIAPAAEALALRARTVARAATDAELPALLRQLRAEEMARIAFRDLAGWADLDETLRALSGLAECLCETALERAGAALQAAYGAPRDAGGDVVQPFVLGMGKLGGHELNFSSDIDLILGFTAPGETAGPRTLANEEYFGRLVQALTRLLAERTPDGFVFRVDWLLRPFGASGPPAMHAAALEEYYQAHGREWERYAFIKARVIAGDRRAGDRLLRTLRPFIYRRYLDFNAIGALRELKRTIEAEVARKELHDNIKLGAGGIREIEFIVQAFQLMRGGQEPRLRSTRLRPVLRFLGEAGYLPPEAAAALDEAYVFLRRLENAIQMQEDDQTHEVPAAPEAQAALAVALDAPDWPALAQRIAAVRARVGGEFDRLFAAPEPHARESGVGSAVAALWAGADGAEPRLAAAGFGADGAGVAEEIRSLRQSRLVRELSDAGLQRLEAVLVLLLEAALQQAAPGTVARRLLQVVAAISGRTTYLALLRESALARAQLVRLCAASPWITDLIARSPILLDQLLDERTLYAPPEREAMRAELEDAFANVAPGDTEAAMNVLRNFRQEVMLRVAAADLVQALPLVKVSDRLTWLAEVILAQTLALIRAELVAQYGAPRRADGAPVEFAVVAYGKFGGIEMGYGSDLDVVFLHDCDALQSDTVDGPRALANEVWLSRLAQRIIHWLSTQTSAGRVYEVDLELRPDGRRGLTVSSLQSFTEYQMTQAWTWEHQALTRARPVAGDASLCERFVQVRRAVLARPRETATLRREVLEMRRRMREHLDKSGPGSFDVKQGAGGLTDIEFITQYLVLRHAAQHPGLTEWSDNWRQTEALRAAGVVTAAQGAQMIELYRIYRAWLHARDLQQAGAVADDSLFQPERAAVRALWRTLIGE